MIWLIGNKGMLGTELSVLFESRNMRFIGTDRDVDITDETAVTDFLHAYSGTDGIHWIVNCAAYTAVDKAEDDRLVCEKLNVTGPSIVSKSAKSAGAKLIHISTDYVFNGNGTRPYTEADATDPTGYYGLTKRDGEMAILAENDRVYIIRTSWLYGYYGNNFVKTMMRLMGEKKELSVVNDQRGSPTWAFDLSQAIASLIESQSEIPFGIYHYSGQGNITWYDFARLIYRLSLDKGLLHNECDIKACTSAEYPSRVRRPPYSVLDKTKIQQALGIQIPSWEESLSRYLDLHRNDKIKGRIK